ncbi:MAG: SPFH domain-containing protein [Dehalococcoidia bacterium]
MPVPVVFPFIVVRQYERLVAFRLGRYIGLKSAGLRLLLPFIDSFLKVDLRENVIDVARQTNITKDNAPIGIDFLIYYKVIDSQAERSVLEVQDFIAAIVGMATTTLRAVIGDIPLDDVLAKREEINQILRVKLDEVTERWGVKVTAVEIREIDPPTEIQNAMNRQMAAERERRAVVLEADGKRQANITVAEGEKQAAILSAEGRRQAAILTAEGERQAAILNAEGFSLALDKIYSVAKGVDSKTMSLQYFETLKQLGASPSTKFIFPMEFTGVLKPFVSMASDSEKKRK